VLLVAGVSVSSCGGTVLPRSDASNASTVDAHADASEQDVGSTSDGGACATLLDVAEPPPIVQVDLDGGVPLQQSALAEAIVYCNYLSRCSAMATYMVNECIMALSQNDSWTYSECDPRPPAFADYECTSVQNIHAHRATLLAEVEAGLVTYDPIAEAACLSAQQEEPCSGVSPWFKGAPCATVFSCAADPGDAGVRDAGAMDGAGCTNLRTSQPALESCTTASDCADASAGPYCVRGYCYDAPCGDHFGCLRFVGEGAPCDSNPPTLGNVTSPGNLRCAPGLTCRGAPGDGGVGTCATPQDVAGPCLMGTAISGCALGLICQCGKCQIPPSEGTCAVNTCKPGVAYCDPKTNTCVPVQAAGADCTAEMAQACAPNLVCDATTNMCESPMP